MGFIRWWAVGRSVGRGYCSGKIEMYLARRCSLANRKQPGGQDTPIVTTDSTINLRANYILQTADEPPAFIVVKSKGWLTGAKDVLEIVSDPSAADDTNPSSYKYRVNLSMETGDERYTFLNTLMWLGSGCRRGQEGNSINFVLLPV